MKYLIQLLIFINLIGTHAYADTSSGFSQKPYDAIKFGLFMEHIKKDLGYAGAKISGFSSKHPMALTGMAITKERVDFIRTAEISQEAKGASIYFRAYMKCNLTDPNKPLTKIVITVEDQPIQAYYVCAKDNSDPSRTQELYIAITPDGQQFIQQAFLNKQYVFVKFIDGFEVPFETDGFTEAWEHRNKSAL